MMIPQMRRSASTIRRRMAVNAGHAPVMRPNASINTRPTVKVAAPMLIAGLVVGLVISVFQAVTQIQEQTLSFIPKVVALIAIVAIAGPWMLDTLVTWTQQLWAAIPNYVGS